ncbi:MAG: hypothetical protein CL489_02965 [Acidobacteria bacterium]|nr:hypothetical protein [Acidobacteriota bacterium]
MSDLPLPGPVKADCPCGCGLFGRPVKKRRGHIRGCPCKPCLAGRNAQRGKAQHRKVARRIGAVGAGRGASSHEESWRGPWRVEVKTGAQVGPILTRWRAAKAQSDASKALGDWRPFVFIADPAVKGAPALAVLELDELLKMGEQ